MSVSMLAVLRILFENMTGTDLRSTRSATGVQMVGVFVANGFLTYTHDEHISKDRYM